MTKINKIQIKSFNELTSHQLYEIISLRIKVFCVEQDCPYQDVDGEDYEAIHVFIEEDNKIISYARIISSTEDPYSIGRVVVDAEFRSHGLAKKIMNCCIEYCLNQQVEIVISAQSYLKDFYKSLGFVSQSEYYLEDDIPHEKMQYKG
jgi:ElaA protein